MNAPMERLVNDEASLYELWQTLMGPGGFARRSIWMVFFEPDGRTIPSIQAIDEVPMLPVRQFVENLEGIVEQLMEGEGVGSAAFLLSRPGSISMSSGDRICTRTLQNLCRIGGWPLHLATCDTIRVFAPDDLVESA
ncbi:MAG: hypothetical protein ACOH16_15210 [Propionibacteriaceae bacterium]